MAVNITTDDFKPYGEAIARAFAFMLDTWLEASQDNEHSPAPTPSEPAASCSHAHASASPRDAQSSGPQPQTQPSTSSNVEVGDSSTSILTCGLTDEVMVALLVREELIAVAQTYLRELNKDRNQRQLIVLERHLAQVAPNLFLCCVSTCLVTNKDTS